ncbi:hypothetical protein [Aliamphritea spongicola]|nr:hypothetical protein [Aliamphritea spongicola]
MSSALQSPVSSADRLGFTIFMAVAIHAVAILGISFSLPDVSEIPQTLEVTLANFKSEEAPDDADFIAQNNQAGSGQLEEKQLPTTREKQNFRRTTYRMSPPVWRLITVSSLMTKCQQLKPLWLKLMASANSN